VAPGELTDLELNEAAALIEARRVSPVELTEACIARAEALDATLHAYITTTFETARQEAQAATDEIAAGRYRGPLHGIPFAIKDLYETVGVRTTAGSKLRENYVPAEDAFVVSRLKEAGAILLGKLSLHEWALGGTNINVWYGTPRNPWGTTRIPGGSSGGSGVAIAAGYCLGSLGSDTRGSIRLPSALCGITGLKPTFGRVSVRGVLPLNWSLDHAGPMARTALDCALILQTIAGYDDADSLSIDAPVPDYMAAIAAPLAGLSIGLPSRYFFDPDLVQTDVLGAVHDAAGVFEALGAVVREVDLPGIDQFTDAFMADGAAYHEQALAEHPDAFSDQVRARLQAGMEMTAVNYSRGRFAQVELKRALMRLFRDVDLLLTPTVPVTAPEIAPTLSSALLLRNTWPFNITGSPAISAPCGFSNDGLPIGMQLVGRDWEEDLVLAAAHAYQQATDWHRRRPIAPP
jgi:aspartyl-tRNA(Asn)/glutamyl-tRNA(Gln) amidotransferase subunit A